ncbi:MAG TPA: adenylate/guanylate cyclase domain-containing protein [Nocardioidaceae bacterium]|nr:adenylate/guanylate cyclase domain-containing protein [Nocardioidaceae bacterium]
MASVRELDTPRAETWPYFMLGLIVVVTVPLMSLIGEQASRKQYVDEQVIARQSEEIAASRELIRRYAPASVADRLEHGDDTVGTAQRRRVTIFFADVVGFTTMADRLDPEALAEIMNDYLGAVAEIVEWQVGTLNEFAGDGHWSRRWYPLGIDQDLQARIGINTGVVSVGTFGSAVRATYTASGCRPTSRLASRPSALPGRCSCPRRAGTWSPTQSRASRAARSRSRACTSRSRRTSPRD